nr:hypothetical protein [Tanacetum cinerariifolium]
KERPEFLRGGMLLHVAKAGVAAHLGACFVLGLIYGLIWHGQPVAPTGQCSVLGAPGHCLAASPARFLQGNAADHGPGLAALRRQVPGGARQRAGFANPLLPYSWERVAGHQTGFACLFTEEFINPQLKTVGVVGSPLFWVGGHPVLQPPAATSLLLRSLFAQMLPAVAAGPLPAPISRHACKCSKRKSWLSRVRAAAWARR